MVVDVDLAAHLRSPATWFEDRRIRLLDYAFVEIRIAVSDSRLESPSDEFSRYRDALVPRFELSWIPQRSWRDFYSPRRI